MRKNIQHLQIGKREQFVTQHLQTSTFLTAEGIKLKATYSEQDVENLEHLDFGAGFGS